VHAHQRVLNDLERTRLSRCRIIRLLAHSSPPPSPVSKLDRRHTGRLRKRDNLLTREEGMGVGEEPNIQPQESLVSINHTVGFLLALNLVWIFWILPGPVQSPLAIQFYNSVRLLSA
jgi:hypothetical protein